MDRKQHEVAQDSVKPEDEPVPSQWTSKRGRTPSPPWKSRCFVFDCRNVKLEVRKKEDVKTKVQPDQQDPQEIPLRLWQKHVALFVTRSADKENAQTDKTLKTEEQTEGDTDRIHFATLNLTGASPIDKLLMMLGGLRTLYVCNMGPRQKTEDDSS